MKHALLILALIIPYAACTDDGDTGTPVGEEGGPCYGDGTCDDGLECNAAGFCEPSTDDPCDGVTCSGHGVCAVAAGETALCVCDAGYHADGLACIEDTVDVCAGQTCSSHGICADNNSTPECICDTGYHADGLTCVEDTVDPCDGITCSSHGTCVDNAGTPECTCDAGYYPDGTDGLDCIDPCAGVTCSGHGTCADNAGTPGTPECTCDAGYYPDGTDGLDCIDPCAGLTCSGHGTCVDSAGSPGTPECTCDAGYYPDGTDCLPDPCYQVTCSGHGTCVDNAGTPECNCDAGYYVDGLDCLDPCAGITCSGHGTCVDNAGTPECTCDAGYHADGADCVVDICQPLVTDDFDDGDYVGWTWSASGAVSFSSDGSGGQQVYLHRVGYSTWSVLTQDVTATGAFELSTKIGLGGTCTGGLGGCVAAIELLDEDGDALNIVVGDYQMSGLSFGFNCPAPWQASACSVQLISDTTATSGMEDVTLSRDANGLLTLTRNGSAVGTAVSAPNFGSIATIQLRGGRPTNPGGGGYFDDVALCANSAPAACSPITTSTLTSAPVNMGEGMAVSPVVNGSIYVMGGAAIKGPSNSSVYYPNVWRYSIANDQWTGLGAILPYAIGQVRTSAVAVGNNGKIYVPPSLGPACSNGWGSHQCLIEFNPVTETASEVACFPSTRWALRLVTASSGIIYTFGGWNGGSITEVWTYDAQSNTLTNTGATAPMAGDALHEQLLASNGLIYLFTAATIYSFDPQTETFSTVTSNSLDRVMKAWEGSDGLLHGIGWTGASNTEMFDASFTLDPTTGSMVTTPLGYTVFNHAGGGYAVDAANGHFYNFGGQLTNGQTPTDYLPDVHRTDCLP